MSRREKRSEAINLFSHQERLKRTHGQEMNAEAISAIAENGGDWLAASSSGHISAAVLPGGIESLIPGPLSPLETLAALQDSVAKVGSVALSQNNL